MLEHLVLEYGYFKYRRVVYTSVNSKYVKQLIAHHPPIPKFEWYDGCKRYVAGMEVIQDQTQVVFQFTFMRDGKPCTFQAILNSYKRQLARRELANLCSVC